MAITLQELLLRFGTAASKAGEKGLNRLLSNLKKLKSATKSTNSGIKSAIPGVNRFGNAFGKVAAKLKRTRSETDKMSSSVRILSNSNGLAVSSLIKLGAKAGIAVMAIRSVYKTMKDAISSANNYIETINLFSVSMGSAAESAFEFGKAASEALGFDLADWMQYQGVFNTIIAGFGVATEKANEMSKQLTQLGYDISSFFNISVEDAMLKIQSGVSGELEPLRRLGYDLSVARMQQEAYNLGIEKQVSNMTQAEKAALRYYMIMTQVSVSHGDMARTIDSPANQLRVLTAQLQMAARAIGNLFIPMLNKVLPYVTAFVKVVRRAAEEVALLFGVELPTVNYDAASASVNSMADTTEEIADNASETADSIEDAVKSIKDLKKTVLGFDELNQLADNSDLLSDSLKDAASELDAAGGAINVPLPTYDFLENYLGNQSDEIADKMWKVLNDLNQKIINGLKEIKKASEPLLDRFIDGFRNGLGKVSLKELKDDTVSISKNLRDIFTDSDVVTAANRFAGTLSYAFGQFAGSGVSLGTSFVTKFVGGFEGFLSSNKDRIKLDIIDVFDVTGDIVKIFGNAASAIADIYTAWGGKNGQRVTSGILSTFYGIASGITKIFGRVNRDIYDIIFRPIIDNQGAFKRAADGILGSIADMWEIIRDFVNYLFDNVISTYDEHIQPLMDSIARGVSDLNRTVLKVWNETLQPKLDSLLGKLRELYELHLKDLIEQLCSVLGKLADLLRALWGKILQPLLHTLIEKFGPIIGTSMIQSLEDLASALGIVVDLFSGLLFTLGEVLDFVTSIFTTDWGEAWEEVKRMAEEDWEAITDAIEGAIKDIKTFASDKFDDIKELASNTWDDVQRDADRIWGDISETISTKMSNLDTDLSSAWTRIKDAASGAWSDMKRDAGTIWDDIKGGLDGMHKAFEDTVNRIKQFLDSHWPPHMPSPHVEWKVHDLGDFGSFRTPDITWHAKGGLFNEATIAGIGEAGAEAVLPLTNKRVMADIASAITGSGGFSGMDEEAFEEAMVRAFERAQASSANRGDTVVYAELKTDDETLARAVARGNEKLEYRYSW